MAACGKGGWGVVGGDLMVQSLILCSLIPEATF